jgi:hypothetical protein
LRFAATSFVFAFIAATSAFPDTAILVALPTEQLALYNAAVAAWGVDVDDPAPTPQMSEAYNNCLWEGAHLTT